MWFAEWVHKKNAGLLRYVDECFRFFDRDIHRTHGGILSEFGIDRHSPGVLILPTLVCAWLVAASPTLGMRLVYTVIAAIVVLITTHSLTKRFQASRGIIADLIIQLMLIGAVDLIVCGLGSDTFQADSLYRHVFIPISFMIVISLAFAAWLASRLFKDLKSASEFPKYLTRTELFASYGPERQVTRPLLVLSGITAPLRGPLQLLLLPALAIVVVPWYWLNWSLGIGLGMSFVALVIAGIDDRFSAMWNLLQGAFFRGGALIISLGIILLAALRVAGFSYVTTVLDTAAGQVVLFMLAGAYIFLWWFDYWIARLLAQQILLLIDPTATRSPYIDYHVERAATSVPKDGRLLQIHGASRLMAIRPSDPAGYEPPRVEHEELIIPAVESGPARNPVAVRLGAITPAPIVPPRVAAHESGEPENPELRKITVFQAYQISELVTLLADTGAPGGKARPLPSQILTRVANYHVLVAGSFLVMAFLGVWYLRSSVQYAELPAQTSKQEGVSLADFLFDAKRVAEHRPVVVIAASGGGTRAALYTTSILYGLSLRNVAQDIVLGSGISGGGAALAYFASKRTALIEDDKDKQAAAWKSFFDAMQQPFIQDVLERASEWRILDGARLGFLLSESFVDRWKLPEDRRTFGQVSDFGLILNTSIAGHFDRSDAPRNKREGKLIDVERRNRKLTKSDLGGGRLIITNLQLGEDFVGEALEGHREHTLPIVVNARDTRLETGAALNANFPPVFSDAAVDVDEQSRYWVTDGGAVDNRGMEMMLYAIREALKQNTGRPLPRLHVVVADASGFSNSFSQDRGVATALAAGTKFASQLALEIVQTIRQIYKDAKQEKDFAFWYLFMPNELRNSDSFGTHWMLQPRIRVRHEGEQERDEVTICGAEMVKLLRCLYTDESACQLSSDGNKVFGWARNQIGQWPELVKALSVKP
jgi:hypothetical protein